MWGANVPARGAGKKPISRQREKEEGAAKTYPAHAVSEKCLFGREKEMWGANVPAREASKKSKHCKGLALTVLIF